MMLESGVFDLNDIIVMNIANRIGTGIALRRLCSHYQPPAKQVLVFMSILSYFAGLLAFVAVAIEYFFGIPTFM